MSSAMAACNAASVNSGSAVAMGVKVLWDQSILLRNTLTIKLPVHNFRHKSAYV
ncbi:exported hypothetical protein [Cupriavidus taiwanensis]|uniref:Uncharacterized protein n=1 Tax=Cupriavidus taiwanensis TaxID=164546 RepID=A0A7Z7JF29_9BURK|nr:exported hypothetical protein [Cupriavidus taiwanensis]SOZ95905.1 exported hypothetical protein [Cupriavidus taiwanensis]SPC25400.1 exported hypothetical protein [Cupriavidus taiwanensis]